MSAKKSFKKAYIVFVAMAVFAGGAWLMQRSFSAERHSGEGNHGGGHGYHGRDDGTLMFREGGQSAFAAIQEVVGILEADPDTDWSRVDLEGLRQHLIDMSNVTLGAEVVSEPIEGGYRFLAMSDDGEVVRSLRAMVLAHAGVMDGVEGWRLRGEEVEGGVILEVMGDDLERIGGLGFIGVMVVGMHHGRHHLALARGEAVHDE